MKLKKEKKEKLTLCPRVYPIPAPSYTQSKAHISGLRPGFFEEHAHALAVPVGSHWDRKRANHILVPG